MKIPAHLIVLLVIMASIGAKAQSVPSLVNYQGKLTDASGNPLPNGTYGVAVRIWNKKSQGVPGEQLIWGQEYNVAVQNGLFNVILGSAGGISISNAVVTDLGFAFGDTERFIGITVTRGTNGSVISGASEIIPRQQILATPYALNGVPKGAVIMWSGSVTNIPIGWALCDGSNGTPDLRDKFVLGAGGSLGVGTNGGFSTHTHLAGTYATSNHVHNIPTHIGQAPVYRGSSYYLGVTVENGTSPWGNQYEINRYGVASETIQTAQDGSSGLTGSSAPASSLPPFYSLAYIIKL